MHVLQVHNHVQLLPPSFTIVSHVLCIAPPVHTACRTFDAFLQKDILRADLSYIEPSAIFAGNAVAAALARQPVGVSCMIS
jgi:hypothetical protein